MAGAYPDPPDRRLAYHEDGTELYVWNTSNGFVTEFVDPGDLDELNDEDGASFVSWPASGRRFAFRFPQPRTLSGIFIAADTSFNVTFEGSNDSTNGNDGTWDSLGSVSVATNSSPTVKYRNSINALSVGPYRWYNFRGATSAVDTLHTVHLYGTPSPEVDRLAFWHPTLDEELGGEYFDWGDMARDSSEDRDFRIKNLAATLTANSVGVSLISQSGSFDSQHLLSDDGSNFAASLALGNSAAGALSTVLTCRRVIDLTYPLGSTAHCQIRARPTSWS